MPVRREVQHLDAEDLQRPGVVLLDEWPVKPMIEPHQQRTKLELVDHVPGLKRAVLPTGKRNYAVVLAAPLVLRDQRIELTATFGPVDVLVTKLDLATNTALPFLIEHERVLRLRIDAVRAVPHVIPRFPRDCMPPESIATTPSSRHPRSDSVQSRTEISWTRGTQTP